MPFMGENFHLPISSSISLSPSSLPLNFSLFGISMSDLPSFPFNSLLSSSKAKYSARIFSFVRIATAQVFYLYEWTQKIPFKSCIYTPKYTRTNHISSFREYPDTFILTASVWQRFKIDVRQKALPWKNNNGVHSHLRGNTIQRREALIRYEFERRFCGNKR